MIFDANEMHTMMNSMNKNMQNKIQDIDELKREIMGLIQEDKLQGLAYNNGKQYFQMVWLPLLEGIKQMCTSTIQGNTQYMHAFHQQVDGSLNAYIDTDYLEEGIERLNRLRSILEHEIDRPKWFRVEMYDNIFEIRQLQNMIEKLAGFDAMAGGYYDDARFYYNQVKSGMNMLSKGTWDETNMSFKMNVTQMSWVGNIHSKKGKDEGEVGSALGMWEGIKKFMLKSIKKEQTKLLKEYWDASEERKTEIVDKLRKNTSMKQMFTDYTIHMDDWQLRILGWSADAVKATDLKEMNTMLEKYEINTVERKRHFFAQVTVESSRGKKLVEDYDIDESYFDKYDGILGNNQPGDGRKFRGGGYIQLTGRYNYTKLSEYVEDPEIANQGYQYVADNYAWEAAGFFWQELNNNNINSIIDNGGSVEDVLRVVNRWELSIPEKVQVRNDYYEQSKVVIY